MFVRADFLRGRRPSVKMALRVGGGTRSATFEIQSVFFRKESTVLEKKGRREWRYSSIKRFFFSSKIILNCLKKACRPRRLKETKYSWEKTTGQMNFLLAIFISSLWMYPLILPPTPPRYVSVPSSSMIPSCSATSTVKTEIVAPESINAEVL